MRRIAVINQKGGVGKTTTSANLGAALAQQGRRVVLIDMDAQANLSISLGVELASNAPSTYTVLLGESTISEALQPTAIANLSLVASNIDLSGAELELAGAIGREHLLRDALSQWESEHKKAHGRPPADYVIFDCPPSLGLLSVNALAAAGEVLITLQTEFLALQGMTKLVDVVQLMRRRVNPELVITGILPCLYDSRLKLAREVLGEIRSYFGAQVFPHPVHTNVKLAEAPSFGKTIFEYAPESKGAQDYRLVAREVMLREGRDPELAGLPPYREARGQMSASVSSDAPAVNAASTLVTMSESNTAPVARASLPAGATPMANSSESEHATRTASAPSTASAKPKASATSTASAMPTASATPMATPTSLANGAQRVNPRPTTNAASLTSSAPTPTHSRSSKFTPAASKPTPASDQVTRVATTGRRGNSAAEDGIEKSARPEPPPSETPTTPRVRGKRGVTASPSAPKTQAPKPSPAVITPPVRMSEAAAAPRNRGASNREPAARESTRRGTRSREGRSGGASPDGPAPARDVPAPVGDKVAPPHEVDARPGEVDARAREARRTSNAASESVGNMPVPGRGAKDVKVVTLTPAPTATRESHEPLRRIVRAEDLPPLPPDAFEILTNYVRDA